MSGAKTAHVAEYKKEIVANIVNLITQYPIIGAVNMENLPTPQLQKMRALLREKVVMTMTKRRIIKIAIEKCKEKKNGIEKIEPYLKGMPALIFTKENPFALFKMLKKNKSPAPAKAGQIAPKDIVIPAGPTDFAPGPVIGELAQIGIKAGVEGGKVAIKQDSTVVKEGEQIKPAVASILTRLGVKPMEVGLDLIAVYEDGTIYTKDVLDIDEDKFIAKLHEAASGAINLSVFAGYPTKDTIELMIGKAFNDAKAVALEYNVIDEGIIDELLGKAERSMLSLKDAANIQVPEKIIREEVKKEKKEAPKSEKTREAQKPKEEKKPFVAETKEEKKEENVLEDEKKIIEEEKQLQKEEKQLEKEEAPVEKEIARDVLEEEEKRLEQERIEKEKEIERIEEGKKKAEEARRREEERINAEKAKEAENTEKNVAELVKKTRLKAEGKEQTAEKLIEEVRAEEPAERKVERKPEAQKQEGKTAEELLSILQKKGSLRGVQTGKAEFKKEERRIERPKEDESKRVEDLTQQLIRKGTLRTK